MENLFLISATIVFYTYIGYGLLLVLAVQVKRLFGKGSITDANDYTPSLTVIVAAYNEADCIAEKIRNTLSLHYPPGLVSYIFITDGSTDDTPRIIETVPAIQLMHRTERNGKAAAIHRAMDEVRSEIVVFTDANAMLNKDALVLVAKHYADKQTGAVAGEKRVDISGVSDASSGEGFYWMYESWLKKNESGLYSVAGAAGELFSIRTSMYEPIAADTIVDDLVLSMQIAAKGKRIVYEPGAFAMEKTSSSINEERKRKLRIAAGGIQAMFRLPFFFLLFSQPLLWLIYTSHRVLRWVVTPYLLVVAMASNVWTSWKDPGSKILTALLVLQLVFYSLAFLGWLFRYTKSPLRIFFIPYYFCLMNFGMIAGLVRYAGRGQSVNWEKAGRRS